MARRATQQHGNPLFESSGTTRRIEFHNNRGCVSWCYLFLGIGGCRATALSCGAENYKRLVAGIFEYKAVADFPGLFSYITEIEDGPSSQEISDWP